MKSDEEFLKGIYEKAEALQNAPVQTQTKNRFASRSMWNGLAAAACVCLLAAVAVVSGGKLTGRGDSGDGVSSTGYETDGEASPMQSRMTNIDENAGIATLSVDHERYVHGTVQTVVDSTESEAGTAACIVLQLADSVDVMTVYVEEADGWSIGEEVWLFVEYQGDGAHLRTNADRYVLAADGEFYNANGAVLKMDEVREKNGIQ